MSTIVAAARQPSLRCCWTDAGFLPIRGASGISADWQEPLARCPAGSWSTIKKLRIPSYEW